VQLFTAHLVHRCFAAPGASRVFSSASGALPIRCRALALLKTVPGTEAKEFVPTLLGYIDFFHARSEK